MTTLERRILELCSLALAYADKKEFEDILLRLKLALIDYEVETEVQRKQRDYPKSA